MTIADYLSEDKILLDMPWATRDEVLAGLCEALAEQGAIPDAKACYEKLLEREELGSTAPGGGIGIPHIHIDESDLCVAFARTKTAIDCDALDKEPCRIFFVVLAPHAKNEEYLRVLASIARLARSSRFRANVLKAQTPAEALDVIRNG